MYSLVKVDLRIGEFNAIISTVHKSCFGFHGETTIGLATGVNITRANRPGRQKKH